MLWKLAQTRQISGLRIDACADVRASRKICDVRSNASQYGFSPQGEQLGSLSSELGVSHTALPAGSRGPQPHSDPAPVEVTIASVGTEGTWGIDTHPPSHWGTSRVQGMFMELTVVCFSHSGATGPRLFIFYFILFDVISTQ